MKRGLCAARAALLVVTGLLLGTGVAAAQTDLAKVLVGRWQGVLQFKKTNTDLTLRITSVKQEDGKWIADGRFGPNPVKIDIDTSGSKPSLRWTGATGIVYDLSLLDDRNLAGTATLTTGQAGQFERERAVKLEKKQ
ncbi:MAG TPA: hypothetical protein VIG07_13695 [Methylomirabilota bacterium]|jgi:hypothetical protein